MFKNITAEIYGFVIDIDPNIDCVNEIYRARLLDIHILWCLRYMEKRT